MRGGGIKEEESDVVLGLYRPIRDVLQTETIEEFRSLLARARSGDIKPTDVTSQDRMGIALLKHRVQSNEGDRCFLAVTGNRLSDIPERDRFSTTGGVREYPS
jgi:hypothetical protein